ncbi:MAG: M24 family metallopeptidase [Gammaproteobacteria bacterium]|nr:M24 family metallopeptidase [Gammaproteobacteria bacterium]
MMNHVEVQKRRKQLLKMLGPQAIAVLASAEEQLRNGDAHYPFRQYSDFLYLTGFNEAHAILVLFKGKSILFCQAINPLTTIWTGPVMGPARAQEELGFDEAYPIEEFEVRIQDYIADATEIHYPFLQAGAWERRLFGAWKNQRQMRHPDRFKASSFHDLSPKLAKMRLIKSEQEIAALQQAVDYSILAHQQVMRGIRQCEFEYQAAAIFHYTLQTQGCMNLAYPSIVASGPNACILHYTESHRRFKPDDLLLIDAGGEHLGYAADITRTYPVQGQWHFCQQAIYELVLSAQMEAIQLLKPGLSWDAVQAKIVVILSQGLIDLGLLSGSLDTVLETQSYRDFYMHNSGHWLGLDVHDVGSYIKDGQSIQLEQGMVMTVEPGIYIASDAKNVPEKWRGIGIRIEDDVLITKAGHNVLSAALPKSIDGLKGIIADA